MKVEIQACNFGTNASATIQHASSCTPNFFSRLFLSKKICLLIFFAFVFFSSVD
jgi:hypothetical protein